MNKAGFTLIELMIVMAIVACLSVISVPSLMKFLAKAKRTEAYIHLRMLANAQKAYFAEHGKYTKIIGPGGLGWNPEGVINYTYGFSDGSTKSHIIGQLRTGAHELRGSSLSAEGFVLCAAGAIYGDKVDVLSIDEHHMIKIVSDALN